MPDSEQALTATLEPSIAAVPAAAWNRCAGSANPFVRHGFLKALEDAGCVGPPETGWVPRHLVIRDDADAVAACMPLYLKGHSMGEYVFDWAWADAYERAGGRYYPKLIAAVPFTPVPGPRLLTAPGADRARLIAALAGTLTEAVETLGVSSVHVNFAGEGEVAMLEQAGFLTRLGHQFHWHNAGYACFEDFLGALTSRRRKTIRKERRAVAESGLRLCRLRGADITEAHWDVFYRFYLDTGSRKWGRPYLNRDAFARIAEAMGEAVLLVLALDGERPVGGALNLIGEDALYGRYWGCLEDYAFLHFEACYYQAIDFAIETGLSRVEAGAQGEHKVQRGYLPQATHSAHWVADPRFRDALSRYLADERDAVAHEMSAYGEHSPYRTPGN